MNPDVFFAVKAWQAIPLPISSPTWRGSDDRSADEREAVDMLQSNQTVFDAETQTRARTKALEGDVVALQTPHRFDCRVDHERNLRQFHDTIDRGGLTLAWEPRGTWPEPPDRVAQLCSESELALVTDLLRRDPLGTTDITYTRLHGLNDDPSNDDDSEARTP